MVAEVTWRESTSVQSVAELDAVLDDLARQFSPDRPQAVHVTRSNGDSLTIVLGSLEGTILNFISSSGDPPYYSSLGIRNVDALFTYYIAGDHHSEAPLSHVISFSAAREAIRRFVTLVRGLPDNVEWEMI